MNNLDCAVATLVLHREARQWDDQAVATDLLRQLGVDPVGEAKNARPDPKLVTEEDVARAEAELAAAKDKVEAARAHLEEQKAAAGEPEDAAKSDAPAPFTMSGPLHGDNHKPE
jgi:hypothetical protein